MVKSVNLDAYVNSDIIVDPVPEFCYSTKEELHQKLMEAHEDVLAGRVKPAEQVFAELRKEFNSWITK
ncbi:MAG: hypothetical protein LUG12_06040 [Erysipelotrichaceae bacterium]|nr:hypothetical protein [Erysipelotrichaceae bacterium]